MRYYYTLDIDGEDFEYEPDYREIIDALREVSAVNIDTLEEDIENGKYDGCADNYDDALDELNDDYYDEMCDYFKEKVGADIKASRDMDEWVDWYYRYGRNY